MAAAAGRVSTPISRWAAVAILLIAAPGALAAEPTDGPAWTKAWPDTDLERAKVPLTEIRSGGVPRDGIPPIDAPDEIAAALGPGFELVEQASEEHRTPRGAAQAFAYALCRRVL